MKVEPRPPPSSSRIENELSNLRTAFGVVQTQLKQVIVGQDQIVQSVLMAVFLQGHVLLEGVPGLGKTLLMSTLGDVLGLGFKRVQFTPDLMPADITGTRVLQQEESGAMRFEFERGPVFANILLADEINRASPKTQSALLEAMQERQVTISGTTHRLPDPFLVLATQNPLESEGTYPLPEAQLDRFMFKLLILFPSQLELVEIMQRTTGGSAPKAQRVVDSTEKILEWGRLVRQVPVAGPVMEYAAKLLMATHPGQGPALQGPQKWIRFGASPRGLQAMVLAGKLRAVLDGRFSVSRQDINEVAKQCLRHRLLLSFEAESDGIRADSVIDQLIQRMA